MEALFSKFQKDPKDTGSSAVQIIRLTKKIQTIAEHVKEHKKDLHCRRGLMAAISNRKSLLAYLKRKNQGTYLQLIQDLGLRH